jgi:hypothetical protein
MSLQTCDNIAKLPNLKLPVHYWLALEQISVREGPYWLRGAIDHGTEEDNH